MQITDIDVVPVEVPAHHPPYKWRDGLPASRPTFTGGVLRIHTDSGHVGIALVARPNATVILEDLLQRHLRAEMIGKDPLLREWWWHRIWELDRLEELPIYIFGQVDVALWDLAGRAVDLPSWKLMGGFRTSIPAYASTVTFDTIQQYLDVADQCRELGYGGIKLHAWGDVARDVKLIHALRSHVGDGFPLMYDGSAGFDLPDAIRVGHALAEADYLWYEEPMREFSVTAYKLLGKKVNVPLLVAETSDGAHLNAADFIASGCAIFGVRTSTRLRGGITGALRVAHLADSFRLRAEVHGADMTSRHLCMSIPNTTYFESMIRSDPVKRDPAIRADGTIQAPLDPGIALPADLELPTELKCFQEGAGKAQGITASLESSVRVD